MKKKSQPPPLFPSETSSSSPPSDSMENTDDESETSRSEDIEAAMLPHPSKKKRKRRYSRPKEPESESEPEPELELELDPYSTAAGSGKKIWEDGSKEKNSREDVVDAQVAENQQVAWNHQVAENEDVDILQDVFDRQYVAAPFKRRLKKVLLSLDPKEKQHWTDMVAYHMKLISKIESDFMQRLWNKQEEERNKA